ncbi:hypothetical protein [Blastococcus brunescens]|uniref:DUF4325 domain-containing protein n=1 Tax=Blastococcus brunescens TaxID=1564165 RepID=A0ABZ1AUE9_9ACTN|nr:hypothetical protein [Blastococcus sp. BMG 8361]WRL62202.1 hypothetical protein U6N30_19420 [Blastococcus sp. BMG 8361]
MHEVENRLAGAVVILDFKRTVAGTPSFADELVEMVLARGGASALQVKHVSSELGEYLLEAAKDHGVSERLLIS